MEPEITTGLFVGDEALIEFYGLRFNPGPNVISKRLLSVLYAMLK